MSDALSLDTLKSILSRAAAEQSEAVAITQRGALTRFSNSVIHQNMAETNGSVSVRAIKEKRLGTASANQTDADTMEYLAKRAAENAAHAPADGDFVSLPKSGGFSRTSRRIAATAECSPGRRADLAAAMISHAKAAGLQAAGSVSTETFSMAVHNSLGSYSRCEQTEARVTFMAMGEDSSGFSQFHGIDIDDVDPIVLAERAVTKAKQSAAPRDVTPGRYDVILEPMAVADMIGFLAYLGLGAQSVQEQRSFMCGKFGEQLVSGLITIKDDASLAGLPALPFDFEGVEKQPVTLIDKGVASQVVYDSYTANKEERASTGHAMPSSSGIGPLPTALAMEAGTTPAAEIIAAAKRAVLVTRFHYTNIEDPLATIYTGMTRDGTFLVEDGQVVHGLKNMRFTQSILEALANVTAVSRETEMVDGLLGACSVPWLAISDFNFSSSTNF